MRTKKSFIESDEVTRVAQVLSSSIKVGYGIFIDKEVLANFLWKNVEVRKIMQEGHRFNIDEIVCLAENLKENFTKYFVVKLK